MEKLKLLKNLIKKNKTNFKKIPVFIILIFFAFICGNIFGLHSKVNENLYTFVLLTIGVTECISYLKYSKSERQIILINNLITNLNVLKRGFLIGIFVEAFKVGS